MDSLDALEAVTAMVPSLALEGGAGGRARSTNQGSSSSTLGMRARSEDSRGTHGSAEVTPDKNKRSGPLVCLGCGRIGEVSACFLKPDELVTWALVGRGQWCRDCHSVWRSMYAGSHSLTLFCEWIKDENNGMEFRFALACFLMLRREGVDRVTSPMLGARIQSIKFVFQLLCLPTMPSVVVPIQMLEADERYSRFLESINGDALVTVRTYSEGDVLGAYVLASHFQNLNEVERLGTVSGLSPPLATSSVSDRAWLARRGWGGAARGAVASGDGGHELSLAIRHRSPTGTKLDSKWSFLVSQCRQTLQVFETEAWADAKESQLTASLQKVGAIASEAMANGRKDIADLAQAEQDGLNVAKRFVKAYRDYVRGKHKLAKLIAQIEVGSQLREYLVARGVCLAPSLTIFAAKLKFFSGFLTGSPIWLASSLRALLFCEAFNVAFTAEIEQKGRAIANPSTWTRSVVIVGIVKVIEALPEAADQKLIDDVATDLGIAVDEIRASRLLADEDGEALAEDVEHVANIFGAYMPEPTVSAVCLDKALAALTHSKRLSTVDDALSDGLAGQAVLARAREWLQRSAQDEIADQRFEQARSFIDDERMPRFTAIDGVFLVANTELVVSFAVMDVLRESVVAVQEALTMWSRVRKEEKMLAMTLWAARLRDVLKAIDVALATHAYDVVAASRFLELGGETGDFDAESPPTDDAALGVVALDETKFVSIMETIETFAEGVDAFLKPCVSALSVAIPPLMKTVEARTLVTAASVQAAELFKTPLPSGASAAVEDWKAAVPGQHPAAFLERASELLRCHKKLASLGTSACTTASSDLGDALLRGGESDGAAPTTATRTSWAAVRGLHTSVCHHPLFGRIEALMKECVQLLVSDFAIALNLHAVKPYAKVDTSAGAGDVVAALIDTKLACVGTKAAAYFDESSNEVTTAEDLKRLLENVFECVGGVGPFRLLLGAMTRDAELEFSSADQVFRVFDFFVSIHKQIVAFGYLASMYMQSDGFALHGNALKANVVRALKTLHAASASTDVDEFCRSIGEHSGQLDPTVLAWQPEAKKAVPIVKVYFFSQLKAAVESVAFATIEQTPKYSAFINDKTYVRPLAKKHLIDWKGRDRLTTLAVDLFHALSTLAKTEVDLSLTAMVDPLRDEIASYNDAFTAAKLALAVIATVQCIQEKAGPEQFSDAEALLSKGHDIPESLQQALISVVSTHPPKRARRAAR